MKSFLNWAVRLTILALIFCHAQGGAIANVKNKTGTNKRMQKRALFEPVLLYPYNACSGILVAIAVPLNLPGRSVFVSYNFEANYNMPNQPSDGYPGPIVRFPGLIPKVTAVSPNGDRNPEDVVLGRDLEKNVEVEASTEIPDEIEGSEDDITTDAPMQKREADESIILTRKGVYRLLESRLDTNGVDGKKCLLLAICESSMHPLLESNMVLGHILHIVLTPSTSATENLPSEYLTAEKLGQQSNCRKYESRCGFSLLNTFTKLF